jgi:hypothetical protein
MTVEALTVVSGGGGRILKPWVQKATAVRGTIVSEIIFVHHLWIFLLSKDVGFGNRPIHQPLWLRFYVASVIGSRLLFPISPQLFSLVLFASVNPLFNAKCFQPYRWFSAVTRLYADDKEIGVRFTAEARGSILQNVPVQLCGRTNLLLNEYRYQFILGKATGAWIWLSPASIAADIFW